MADAAGIYYLHGFASGPGSRKARFFREKLETLGFGVTIPDLAAGNFRDLTVGAQLALLENLIANRPVTLVGSSLGGYIASLYAASHPEVTRLLLLAPAFGFLQLWESEIGVNRLAEWKRTGEIQVFHYGEGKLLPLGYGFIEDASRFDPFPKVHQPVLIFHGDRDPVVPIAQSLAFIHRCPQAELVRVPSGHELTDVLDSIWPRAQEFLQPEL